ncbi:hypothetical protein BC827DRAFT_1202193 [Russula dissimulans]|nr:hypothetical protein BC827DRAFT_1202193 [Russula dissimulans]
MLHADSEVHAKCWHELDIRLKALIQKLNLLREGTLRCRLNRMLECNNQLLTKYDYVDPTEFQSLKDEVESLRAETSTWEAQQATHTEQLTGQQEKWKLM